ncbi:hypothetical protein [uncultured Bacteroides sp.]|uniref:hypothetical protein n=1 Tax=uncultured Bacteroides sp. TaxID=162156 RepID=UPI0025F53DB4|nr:hypothetical protein [uncultured Bacteroides sp.]
MKWITKDVLRKILLDNYDYPTDEVDLTLQQIELLSPEGKEYLFFLLNTGDLPNVSYNDLSLKTMKSQNPAMTDIAVLIIYDGMTSLLKKRDEI